MTALDIARDVLHPKHQPGMTDAEMERASRERDAFEAVRDHVKALGDALNGGDKAHVVAAIVLGLLEQHRYLQNEAILAILTALGDFGNLPEGMTVDARNAYAFGLCQKVRKALKDDLFWRDK